MKRYYLNKFAQNNDDHEVHVEYCSFLLSLQNRTELGIFSNCKDDIKMQKNTIRRLMDITTVQMNAILNNDTTVFHLKYNGHKQQQPLCLNNVINC